VSDIITDIETVVASLRVEVDGAPYFEFGHRQEIAKALDVKTMDAVFKYQKFPLIALRLDIPEICESSGMIEYALNLAIISKTERNYNARQRKEHVFDPILEPLYKRFIEALRKSRLFFWEGMQQSPSHTKINRYFWGTPSSEKNERNIFNDPIDAIELVNLRLKQLKSEC
jgi:hypothetical protein